jgi:hypothetical protein
LLIDVSTVRVDSIDISDADGDASVVTVLFSATGVFGYWGKEGSPESSDPTVCLAGPSSRDTTPFSIVDERQEISNIRRYVKGERAKFQLSPLFYDTLMILDLFVPDKTVAPRSKDMSTRLLDMASLSDFSDF